MEIKRKIIYEGVEIIHKRENNDVKDSVVFDKDNANYNSNSSWYNFRFLRSIEFALQIQLYKNGYLYLNQVYEMLGAKWDPENTNYCFKSDSNNIRFETFENDGVYTIYILCK